MQIYFFDINLQENTRRMINRQIERKLRDLMTKYPIVTITGPRQSGKTYLLRQVFPDYRYVSLEDIDMREFAASDPRGFLSTYSDRVIIDEAQRVPSLFSYLQTYVDKEGREGMYLLAGSQNFLLLSGINQSLAGRTAILRLLPFSYRELTDKGIAADAVDEWIFTGGYPRIYDKGISATDYYPNYIATYVERDVRQMRNIGNLSVFERFIRLCAARIGQLFNISAVANESGVSVSTVNAWLSILEASYICYRLQPNYNNYNKRLVKTPKLYFYDTGLACSLLNIHNSRQLATHYLRGGLFENMVINELSKRCYNEGSEPDFTFWRDSVGNEVDLIAHTPDGVEAYEIKSSATFSLDFFKGLKKWGALSGEEKRSVIYGGDVSLTTSEGEVKSWKTV